MDLSEHRQGRALVSAGVDEPAVLATGIYSLCTAPDKLMGTSKGNFKILFKKESVLDQLFFICLLACFPDSVKRCNRKGFVPMGL